MLAVVIRRDFALIISSLSVSLDSHPKVAKGRDSIQVRIHLKSLSPSISIKKGAERLHDDKNMTWNISD